jgi:hypothetical protein
MAKTMASGIPAFWAYYRAALAANYQRHWSTILTFLVAGAVVMVIGIWVTASSQGQFESAAVISPQKQMDEGGGAAPSLSGVSSVLGSFFQGGQGGASDNLVAFQQLLPTAELANALIRNTQFMQIAFPSRQVHRSLPSRMVRGFFGRATPTTVQPFDVQNFVTGSFYVQKLTAPDYIEITYANPNRVGAITALRILLATSDGILRGRERASLTTQIRYLSNTIAHSTDVTQQAIFRQMLEQKLSAELLLDTQPTYAFRIFDAPDAPAIQTSPNLSIMLAIVIAASVIAGVLAVFVKKYVVERTRAPQ